MVSHRCSLQPILGIITRHTKNLEIYGHQMPLRLPPFWKCLCVCVIVGGLLAVGLATNILKNLLVLEPRLPPFLVFVIHVLYTSDIH